MSANLSPERLEAIRHAITFANSNEEGIAQCADSRMLAEDEEGGTAYWIVYTNRDTVLSEVRRQREKVRGWLSLLAKSRMPADTRGRLVQEIDTELRRHPAMLTYFVNGGRVSAKLEPGTSDQFLVVYGCALLLEESTGLRKRLRRCKLSECGAFFLHLGKGGKDYCCTAHSGRARQRRYRRK